MNKYLLIGGNGVIGHFLTRRLVGAGHRPVVMSRSGDTALIADVCASCDVVRGDVTDAARLEEIVSSYRISHIAHLGAALSAVSEADPPKGVRANVEGAAVVLEVARNNGVKRVIMASSKAVYGMPGGEFAYPSYKPVPEDAPLDPVTMYGVTKLAAEHVGRWYQRKYGLEVASLRFGATIGPGKLGRHAGAHSRFSQIIESAMAGKPMSIPGGGDAICDSLFNDDVAHGIVCALDAPRLLHDVFNIATGTGFSLKDFAQAVQRLYPNAELSVGSGYGDAISATNFVLDVTRARNELGFSADANTDRIVENYVSTMQRLRLAPNISK